MEVADHMSLLSLIINWTVQFEQTAVEINNIPRGKIKTEHNFNIAFGNKIMQHFDTFCFKLF